jgi:cell division protein FtsQ
MKTMDRRIAERRHRVTEERARTRLRLVIGLVALVALAAAGFALVRSPLLSVNRVTVTGAEHSDPAAVLARLDVVLGMPTVSVDAGAIEAAIRADPWVADARVVVSWPGSLDVEVTEHVPMAAVTTAGGYAYVTSGGAVVEMLDDPIGLALIAVNVPETIRPGATISTAATLGALEFIDWLPDDIARVTVVSVDEGGQLTATIDDLTVRLGRAREMQSKASALVALIGHGLAPGSSIDITAPRRPAVANPQPEVEGEGETPPEVPPTD